MEPLLLVLPVLVAALAALWWWRGRRGTSRGAVKGKLDMLDTVTGWEPQATRLMTLQERAAYGTLARALPERVILAQVPLARFIRVPTRYSYAEWLARVGQLCADLVVCDSASQVLAVVQVRPAQESGERARKRQERMRRVLKRAGIQMHVWTENALPSVTVAREIFMPPDETPATAAAKPAPGPSIEARRAALEDMLRTAPALPDEVTELEDPPPSTFFDPLDSGPAPLETPRRGPRQA